MEILKKPIVWLLEKKWLGLMLVFGLALGIGLSTFYRGAVSPKERTDLTVFLKAGEMVAIGRADHIYGIENKRHWHYVYAPMLAVLLAPVSQWPLVATVPLAYGLSLACLAGTILLTRRFKKPACPAPWQIALALLLSLPLLLNTLTRGQFGIITLFFAAAIFQSYLQERKILTGLLLALAVTLKISPLAFLIFFFFVKREWRILLTCFGGFILFFFLLPSLVIGFDTNWTLLGTWRHLMSISQSDHAYQHYLWGELFTPFTEDNQSLYAVITRLSWGSLSAFIGHSNAWIRNLTAAAGIFLLALAMGHTRKRTQPPDALRLLAEFSLFPMLMLFTSPVTQIHHYTVIYFLFLAAMMLEERCPSGSLSRKWLAAGIGIGALSLMLGMVIPAVGFWGGPLWGALLLWGIVFFCLRIQSRESYKRPS